MPLRVRLTLWYGTALALVLVVFGGTLYAVLAREDNQDERQRSPVPEREADS